MLGLAMNWRKIILCKFEFLKLSHNIHAFGIFFCCHHERRHLLCFSSILSLCRRERERGGGGNCGRWLMVDGPALYVRWQGKGSFVLFYQPYKLLLCMCLTPSCSLENPTGPKWTNYLHWQGKTETVGERPVPLPFCPLQISHGLVWVWKWAFVLKG